ncbi:MBG domain-containing protein [Gaoshiqia sp. Z1-71]|uniref:MBG domain-containing protein n=1 Tax=Gaoshiqia hydrogeniformans TaxID=3290090 RepID=UPI003BF8EE4F
MLFYPVSKSAAYNQTYAKAYNTLASEGLVLSPAKLVYFFPDENQVVDKSFILNVIDNISTPETAGLAALLPNQRQPFAFEAAYASSKPGSAPLMALPPPTASTGDWNDPTIWTPNGVPSSSNDVIIPNGVTVTINGDAVCQNLTIQSGATLVFNTDNTLAISGDLTISGTLTMISGSNINLSGNWINDGAFTAGGGTVTFTGSNSATLGGSSTSSFYNLILNKGTDISAELVVSSNVNISYPVFTNGLLKINSGIVDLTHTFAIPLTAGIELNNSAATLTTGDFTITNNGLIRITDGTANFGNSTGNSVHTQVDGAFIVSGGTVNIAGRLENTAGGTLGSTGIQSGISISGGTITLAIIGNGSGTTGSLNVTQNGYFNFTGGTIIFEEPGSAIDLQFAAESTNGTKTITNGVFQFGNSNTASGSSFVINSAVALRNITTYDNIDLKLAGTLTLENAPTLGTNSLIDPNEQVIRYLVSGAGIYQFPIMDAGGNNLSASITINSASAFGTGAYMELTMYGSKHPQNTNTTNYLKRYWLVRSSGITDINYDVSATVLTTDFVGTPGDVTVGTYTSGTLWSKATTASLSTTNLIIAGLSSDTEISGISDIPLTVSITNGETASVCNGSAVTLNTTVTGDSPITYSWSSIPGGYSSTESAITITPGSTTEYTVTVTDGNGFTASDQIEVTVNTPPVCSITGATSVVYGTTTNYSAPEGMTTYSWSVSGNGIVVGTNDTKDITVDATAAGSYTLDLEITDANGCTSSCSQVVVVNKASMTVTADAKSKIYGDADPELTYQITSGSLVETDAFSGSLTRVAGEDVGTYEIQQGTLALSSNYSLTYVAANLTITEKAITVTADAKSKIYGDTDPSLTYQTTSGSLVGTDAFSGSLTRVAGEDVGTYEIQQGTLALSSNYSLTYVAANLTITEKAITVTADAKSKIYGDTDPSLTYQTTSGSLVGTDAFSGSLTRVAGEDVGTYEIQQGTLALSSNYSLTYVAANLTITEKAITVTADAKSKIYGDTDPSLTYQTTSGSLVGTDAFSGSLTRVADEDVGTYEIEQGTLALSSNYSLTYVAANLTITVKSLTPSITAENKCYDGNATTTLSSRTLSGIVDGDDVSLAVGTATFNNATVGTGKTVTASGLTLTGTDAGNYVLSPATATTTADIYALPVPGISGDLTVCSGTEAELYTTEAGMTDYDWTVSGGTVTAGGTSNDHTITVDWGAAGTGTITVNYTNATGCTADASTQRSVTIYALPEPSISGVEEACSGSAGNVYTTQAGMTNYQWTVNGGTITAGGGTGNSSVTVSWGAAGTGTVRVNYTNANGCTANQPAEKEVTINALPTPTIDGPANACLSSTGNTYTTEADMLAYSWSIPSNGGTITGGQGTNTITVTWSSAGSRTVRVTYQNSYGCSPASPTDYGVTVYANFVPGNIGTAQSICYNTAPAELTHTAAASGGSGNYAYQWQSSPDGTSNWTDIPDAVSQTYQADALTTTTWYRLAVTDQDCGLKQTAGIRILVYADLSPGTIGSDKSICYNTLPGTISQLTAASGGPNSYTYQWQSSPDGINNWTDISGATASTYTPGPLTATTWYRRLVTSGDCGTVISNVVKITVYDELLPGSIGSDQTICYNTVPAALTDETSPSGGTGLTYLWQQKPVSGAWTNVSGANGLSYTPPALTQTMIYRRGTTSASGCGTVYSNEITVTVWPNLTAGTVGSAQTICYNSTPAGLSQTTAPTGGTGAYSYQWQSSPDNSSWTNISGATASTYTPGQLTATTWFRRVVTDAECGSANSVSVQITVRAQLLPGSIGSDKSICYNTSPGAFTQSLPTGGTGTYSYQWQSSPDNSSWTDISGATASTYTPGPLTATTWYRRLVTSGDCGTVISNVVQITVYDQLDGGTIGSDQSICYNTVPAALTNETSPSGGTGLTYQWRQRTVSGTWTDIGGATDLTYTPPALTQTMLYRRAVSSASNCGTVYSNEITVTVWPNLTAGAIGSAQTICYNTQPAGLSQTTAPTGGTGTYSYQWQSSPNNATWTDISGAVNPNYQPPVLTASGYYRRAVTSGSCATVYSASVFITVQTEVFPGTIAGDQTICSGTSASQLTSTNFGSGGSGTISYRWERSVDGISWTTIPSASSSTYSPGTLTQTTRYRRYRLSTQNGVVCESAASNVVTVTVQAPLSANTISADQLICENTSPAGLTGTTVTAGSGTITYQWQVSSTGASSGFTDISGATGKDYAIPGTLLADRWYQRIATSTLNGQSCTSISNAVYVNVVSINAGTISNVGVVCEGTDPAAFTGTQASGDGPFTYQWQSSLNGTDYTDIAGATMPFYDPPALGEDTWYRRVAVSSLKTDCSKATAAFVIGVNNIDPGSIGPDLDYCYGADPPLLATTPAVTDGSAVYSWYRSYNGVSFDNIAINTEYYNPPVVTADIWYRRYVSSTVNGTTCNTDYAEMKISVYPYPQVGAIAPIVTCEGSPFTITATASVSTGTPTYTLNRLNPASPMPVANVNNTGVFDIDPYLEPNTPVTGLHQYQVTITNGDEGACEITVPVNVTIYSLPAITLTASCASGADGVIQMTGTVDYPVGAVVEYQLLDISNNIIVSWTTDPTFSGLSYGLYTVLARNSAYPGCETMLIGEILGKTVDAANMTVCQYTDWTEDMGLAATSLCFTWAGAQHTFAEVCTDPNKNYVAAGASSSRDNYQPGSLVQYNVLSTFKPTQGQISIKDCKAKPEATFSIYEYPFYPANPAYNFVELITTVCPNAVTLSGLDPNQVYVVVINSPDLTTVECTEPWFTKGDKVQVATAIGEVFWYLTDNESETHFATGPFIDPTDYPATGVTGTDIPGTWTVYAGCETGPCRQPVTFTVTPVPHVMYQHVELCSGLATNIQLVAIDDQTPAQTIPAANVTYEWYPTNLNGTASWNVSCDENSPCTGPVIAVNLTSESVCPTVQFRVRATVNGCAGPWEPVDVYVLDSQNHDPPTPLEDLSFTCLSEVTAPPVVSLQHSCMPLMQPVPVITANNGAGCAADPLVFTRTWTFEDACDTTILVQTVTVIDDVPPTFTVPADITIQKDEFCYDDRHNLTLTGNVTDEADNCSPSGPYLQATYADTNEEPGDCAGEWVITRTWTLTDNCGNTTQQNQLITIVDELPPSFTAPADITIYSDSNCDYDADPAITGDVTNEADNCTPSGIGLQATYSDVTEDGDCPGKRIITRTWSLTDDCGNRADDQIQIITVMDNIKPTFTRPADASIVADADCNYVADTTITGSVSQKWDNCTPVEQLQVVYVDSYLEGDCEGAVVISRTWRLQDGCGNWADDQVQLITQAISVGDNTPPVFTAPDDITLYRTADCMLPDVTNLNLTGDVTDEFDNCSTGINATYEDSEPIGVDNCTTEIHRTWTLVDKCGNEAEPQVQVITIADNTPPVLADVPSVSFCVENIFEGTYNGLPEPDADIAEPRPDYYLFHAGDTGLDLDAGAYFSDACTPAGNIALNWSITDNYGQPVADENGTPLTGITGQPSAHGADIVFAGAPNGNVYYTITYWLADYCGNESAPKSAGITITPRPEVIKLTGN